MKSRPDTLRSIEAQPFDVCIIGGGATGAGCALDAQLRGLSTVLIEAADFASGTSSASTKMVHGGVRYLEQAVRRLDFAEYRVVKRALDERIHMLRNAPYLTRTKQFITPCYGLSEAAYYEAGLKLYDWIAGRAGLAPSRFFAHDEVLEKLPRLSGRGLIGGVAYTDGQFDDARYNIALVLTFAQAGGEAVNYARVVEFRKNAGGQLTAADIEDRISGGHFEVRAKCFVNATGPFADSIRELATPGAGRRMRLSKGVHILLPLERFSPTDATAAEAGDALLIPKTEDGRVLFAIPWMGRLLVGTTDEEIDHPDERLVAKAEVEYLLCHLNRYLADPVSVGDVVSAFAGVRPLVSPARSRSSETRELAREHVVEVDRVTGLVSIMGGKWTTYRAMAEDTIDAVCGRLRCDRGPCRTLDYPLAGSEGFSGDLWQTLARDFEIAEPVARHLSSKFGARAREIMKIASEAPNNLAAPLALGGIPIKAEIVFCARSEMALSIEDVLARRIGLESYSWSESIRTAPVVAELLGRELGWSMEEKKTAVDQYVPRIKGLMRESGSGS
jgi:glycerol-3-phosphate dehydrogenase